MSIDKASEKLIDSFVKVLEKHHVKPLAQTSIEEYRDKTTKVSQELMGTIKIKSKSHSISGLDNNQIPIKIFVPDYKAEKYPTLIYCHGGGFIANLDLDDSTCEYIAKQSGWQVIAVDYRLAPEHKFPAAVNDAYAVTKWAFEDANFAIDKDRIAVCGCSSGANFMALVALRMRDAGYKLTQQILVSLPADLAASLDAYAEYAEQDVILTREAMFYCYQHYIPQDMDANNPQLSPYYADLHDVAPATLIVGEYDQLRSDTEAYYEKLQEAGVASKKIVISGKTHAFLIIKEAYDDIIVADYVIAALKEK